MGKYTKAPGMHELAYNSWLLKMHRRLNDRAESARLCRDGDTTEFKGPASDWWLSSMFIFKSTPIPCNTPELAIYKNKLINRDINLTGLNKLCKPCKYYSL